MMSNISHVVIAQKMSEPVQIEGVPSNRSDKNVGIVIAVVLVLIVVYILYSTCDCGKSLMFDPVSSTTFDPVIADFPTPRTFDPNSPNNRFKISKNPDYIRYLRAKYSDQPRI
jgi:hypothetical protein